MAQQGTCAVCWTVAILAQAISCSNGSLLSRGPSACLLVCEFCFSVRRSMPRKGQVEVLHGWTQLIRGVRPKSEKWPRAEKQSAVPARVGTSKAREMASTTSVSEGESRYFHARSKATCVSVRSSVGSFRRYEKPGGHNVAGVSEVGPACCSGTSSGCSVGTRAQKRLDSLDEERAKLVSELEEGQARLQRLRVEASQKPQEPNATAPAPPPHWAAELQRLQSLVAQMQQERIQLGAQQWRIQLGPRQVEEELQDLRWEVDPWWVCIQLVPTGWRH